MAPSVPGPFLFQSAHPKAVWRMCGTWWRSHCCRRDRCRSISSSVARLSATTPRRVPSCSHCRTGANCRQLSLPLDSVINAGVGTFRFLIPLSIPSTVLGCARSYAPDVRSFFPSRCENQLASEIADLCHIKWPALFADDRTATTAWHERRGRVASDPRRPWSSDGILFDLLRDSGERE